jgi:hypothetical protein
MAKRNIGDCIRYNSIIGIVKEINPYYVIYWIHKKNTGEQNYRFCRK